MPHVGSALSVCGALSVPAGGAVPVEDVLMETVPVEAVLLHRNLAHSVSMPLDPVFPANRRINREIPPINHDPSRSKAVLSVDAR